MSKAATPEGTTVVAPSAQVNGQPLPDSAQQALVRTVIDTHLHLPGMFELTFADNSGTVLSNAGIDIGTKVSLSSAAADGTPQLLITGEVTGLEAICHRYTSYTIVRGYDLCHRMQRVRRTRTFLDATDSDIASQIAKGAGLTELDIDPSSTVNAFVGQCDQTDWEFLSQRASEIGYETGISCGTFYFRGASSAATADGAPIELAFGENLQRFLPRVTAGNIPSSAEVRVWDPLQDQIVAQTVEVSSGTATLNGTTPAGLAQKFGTTQSASTAQAGAPAVGNLGPAPATTAHVIYDRPVAVGPALSAAASPAAAGLADRLASTFAEAEGEAAGNPGIQPGTVVNVSGVPSAFCGSWLITNAQHVIDLREGGYATRFVVSGRQERSLLGLASAGRTRPRPPRMPGVYCGVVTNVSDPQGKGQVKVTLPWLSPDYETNWSPVVQFGAGKRSGALFLPEVGDEVLVGFEFGDPRRAYVLGGIVNNNTGYSLDGTQIGSAVTTAGETAAVALRGFASPSQNVLAFRDEFPPGDGEPPKASAIVLGTGDESLALEIDQVNGTVKLLCSPQPPNSKAEQGTLSIECGPRGTINVTAGDGGTVNIDGGANLNLKAQESISIQSQGQVAIKGSQIQLN